MSLKVVHRFVSFCSLLAVYVIKMQELVDVFSVTKLDKLSWFWAHIVFMFD